MAAISHSKSLPVSFFFQFLSIGFPMFPFPVLCDVVQDGVNFAKCLGPSKHFGIQSLTNKI